MMHEFLIAIEKREQEIENATYECCSGKFEKQAQHFGWTVGLHKRCNAGVFGMQISHRSQLSQFSPSHLYDEASALVTPCCWRGNAPKTNRLPTTRIIQIPWKQKDLEDEFRAQSIARRTIAMAMPPFIEERPKPNPRSNIELSSSYSSWCRTACLGLEIAASKITDVDTKKKLMYATGRWGCLRLFRKSFFWTDFVFFDLAVSASARKTCKAATPASECLSA